jgi:DNA-binding transcriptional MerR regulator
VPTEDEIKRITELRDQGYSLEEIGEKLKKDKSTISRWFKSIGLDCNAVLQRCTTKKATEARRTYDKARRLELNDRLFTRLEEFLNGPVTPRDYKDIMVSYGILEDKRSLLEPLQTDHTISGLAEMREAIHEERKNVMEAITEDVQSG